MNQVVEDYIRPAISYANSALRLVFDPVSVNCNQCKRELTHVGGDVTSDGKAIYCHENGNPLNCVNAAMNVGNHKGFSFDVTHYSAREIQQGIKTGELNLTPLERKAQATTS